MGHLQFDPHGVNVRACARALVSALVRTGEASIVLSDPCSRIVVLAVRCCNQETAAHLVSVALDAAAATKAHAA